MLLVDGVYMADKNIIELTRGKIAIVDNDDYIYLSSKSWYADVAGYALRTEKINGKKQAVWMHRLIMDCPKNKFIDHVNGDRLDNRKVNLRVCEHRQNLANTKIRKDNVTGFKGVSVTKRSTSFEAKIQHQGKNIYIGRFKDKLDAAKAYNQKAQELFGVFANLNEVNNG